MVKLFLAVPVIFLTLLTNQVKSLDQSHQETATAVEQHQNLIVEKRLAHQKTLKKAKLAKARAKVLKAKKVAQTAPIKPKTTTTGVEQWRRLVAFYFPASQVENALAVIKAESGGNKMALSPTCDRGLFQINCVHIDKVKGNLDALYDPETNVQVALQIWEAQGWYPWVTARALGLI